MEVSEEGIMSLAKREKNLETVGTIIRLKKDETGSTSAAWKAIDAAHSPEKYKRTLILRTTKSEKTIKDLLGPDATVKMVSDQQMAGAFYELKISRDEEALLRVAQIYGTLVQENGDFLYSEDNEFLLRVKDTWKTIIRAKLQSTLEWQIRKGEVSDTLRG